MLLKNSLEEIKTFIKPNNVLATLEERYCYSTDASNLEKNAQTPDLVVFVETIADVQKILQYANQHKIPVISRGAGTNMVGACVCSQGGIVLNFSKMNKILELNPEDMTIKVQPGVLLNDLKVEAEKQGLFYPPDPSNYKVSTIGGSIALSSGGALAFKYGTTKDYVLSLKIVTADGKLMTVGADTAKNSVGYHLAQLIVGSEGTLGVVVEATLKLIPKPLSYQLVVAYFDSINKAIQSVNNITNAHLYPASIDFMDKNSMMTVEKFIGCGLKQENECLLLIDLDSYSSKIEEEGNKVRDILIKNGAKEVNLLNREQAELIWQARRSSYAATTRLAPDVVSDDVIVPRSKLSHLLNECNRLSKKYDLKLCIVGHVGDGNIHPQVALNLENEEEFRNYNSFKAELYSLVKELNGSISAEHGVGLEKKPYLENTIDSNAIEYMKLIKRVFDPNNILNPGKIF